MNFNLDTTIVIVFLAVNLFFGLYIGRGIKTIKQYAIGDRNFSTATIAATIIAIWISGSYFFLNISESYKEGLWYIIAGSGDIIGLMMIGLIFAPKMEEFLGQISVAESMGSLYGKQVRIITAIASIAHAVGKIALQIKVFSTIFSHFLGMSTDYATLVSSFIVIVYSAWGGIKSVTFTDIIQFATFGVFIPTFAMFIWQAMDSETSVNALQNNLISDYNQFSFTHPKFLPNLFLFLYFLIPGLSSSTFQRVLMAKNTKQIGMSFVIAALVCLFIHLSSCFIGLLVAAHNPNLNSSNIAMYIIDTYSIAPALKGFAVAGVIAMVMSTADSWINTAAVIFTHDLCKPLGLKIKNELTLSRIFSIIIGVVAVILALSTNSLLKLILLRANFYVPIVSPSLILAILGFRSNTKSVLIGMAAGGITVLIWRNFIQEVTGIDSVVPAMTCNFVFFISAHYILKAPGGWKKNKHSKEITESHKSSFLIKSLYDFIKFDLLQYCKKNAPKQDITYIFFSLFSAGSILTVVFMLDKAIHKQYLNILTLLQIIALIIATSLTCYKLWHDNFKKYVGLIWMTSIFFNMAFVSSFLVLISNFSHAALFMFTLNLIIISTLLSWQASLIMATLGVLSSMAIYQNYVADSNILNNVYDLKFKIAYVLFIITGFTLAFIKPKQEQQALSEEKVEHLSDRVEDQEKALNTAENLKEEFIRNLTHEFHAPMTGIKSTVDTLHELYDQLPEETRRKAIENIYNSSVRLEAFEASLVSLSKLANANYQFNIEKIDLTELVLNSLNTCRKLYIENKDQDKREFVLNLENKVIAMVDEYYIRQTVDNLIINAISYCKKGKITISLSKNNSYVEFSISDEGLGIPHNELIDIFGTFSISSRTKTPAGGRGVGLTLCKKVVSLHDGKIWAENNEKKGAIFRFILPIKQV